MDRPQNLIWRACGVGGDPDVKGWAGSGLGLSIVKEVAELHGGRVEVSSTLGAGTTVSLFLPAQAAGAPAEGGTGVTAEA